MSLQTNLICILEISNSFESMNLNISAFFINSSRF